MSVNKRIFFAVSVSWVSRILTILGNLLLIPLYFSSLSKEELGVWFLLSNSQGLLEVLGLGVAPTLGRRIALAKGKNGSELNVVFSEESINEIGDLVATGKVMLIAIAIISLVVSLIAGEIFINQLDLQELSFNKVKFSWLLLSVGYSSSVWLNYQYSLLSGLGYVGLTGMLDTCLNIILMIANAITVFVGGGLIELACISMVFRILQRLLVTMYIKLKKPYILKFKGKWDFNLAKSLSKISLLCWMTFLGKLLLVRTDQYFIALVSGTQKVPAYQATYQLVSNLGVFASSIIKPSSPFLSQLWQAKNLEKMHSIILRSALLGLLILASGTSFLLVSGKELISLWLGDGNFLGYNVLMTICILFVLDAQNGSIVFSARSIGKEDFAISSLLAGSLNIVFTYFLIRELGIWGVPLATVLSVLLTTTWYAFYQGLKSLKIPLPLYFKTVSLRSFLVFALSLILQFSAKRILEIYSFHTIVPVMVTGLISALIFFLSIWLLILNKEERDKYKSKLFKLH